MGGSGRRPLRPKPPGAVQVGRVWLDAFLDYSAGECHLAENTVAAYGRDLRRFVAWLQGRTAASLTIRDLADYEELAHEVQADPVALEAHLFGVQSELYGRRVRIDLIRRLRETRKFENADALVAQLRRDETAARAALADS